MTLRSVLTLGVLVVAAASTHGQERRVVDLRVVSVDPAGFRLDVRNVSAKRLDYPVRLTVRLTRLDDTKGPEHAHLIWSFIDPSSGLYREVSPLVKPPRLELEPEQVKTIKVQYGELRWFYEYLGTRTPERLSDLAESGEFDLSVWLEFTPGPWPGADVGPIRVSILVRSSTSPKRMQLTKLRGAPERQDEVPPCAPAGEMDGGTASQLIRSVRRTRVPAEPVPLSGRRPGH